MNKFITLIPVLILISFCASSQKVKIGLNAGLSLANYYTKAAGTTESANSKPGITAGFIADLPLDVHFSMQPGLNFTQKGTRDKETSNGSTMKMTVNINTLEIPLNILYNINSTAGRFFIGAGPSLAIGLSGKQKITSDGDSYSSSIHFGKKLTDDLRRIDLGANAVTGFYFPNGLMIALNYNLGLNNLTPDEFTDENFTSRYFGLRLGWMINKAKAEK